MPALGTVALVCASTIGVLFFNKPVAPKTTTSTAPTRSPGDIAASPNDTVPETTLVSGEPTEKTPVRVEEAKIANDKPPTPIPDPTAVVGYETKEPKPVVAKVPAAPVSVNAATTMSLTCADGKIIFNGKQDLKFVDNQPSMEITEEGGVKFAHLVFNGTDQSAELPPVSRGQGSLEMIAKLPQTKTSIFLDSNYQRLTLRKNRDGLRWRIAGVQKPATIRNDAKLVDFNKWHHIAITWKSGEDAILYVDGVEHDQYSYIHEQPHFAEYEEVVLGRTRGSSGRFYECRVNKFVVYDQPLSADEIAKLNESVRQTYPFIFR